MIAGTERRRLIVSGCILLLVAGVTIATGVWQIFETRSSRTELVLEGNLATAKTAAQLVEATLFAYADTVRGVAMSDEFVDLILTSKWQEATAFLEGLQEVDPDVTAAAVVDASGRLQAIDPFDPSIIGADFSFRSYFKEAISKPGEAFVSEVFVRQGNPKAAVVAVSSAVRDDAGQVVGVLVVTIPATRVALIASSAELPNEGSMRIFDRTGQRVSTVAGSVPAARPFAQLNEALAGRSGVGEGKVPGLPGDRLMAFAAVPGMGMGVVVEQSQQVVLRAVNGLTARLLFIGSLGALALLAASVMLTRLLSQLTQERKRTAAIVSSIADGVVTTDSEGRIESVNPAALELIGRPAEELCGEPYERVFVLKDEAGNAIKTEDRPLIRALRTESPARIMGGKAILASATGRMIPVTIAAAPVLDDEGHNHGGVAVIRDVTVERQADQMKSAFVSTVSHELRTPLTMIQGFSELMLSGELSRQRGMEAAEQIHTSAERLARLIEDLLSVSRIESGKVVMRLEPVDVGEVVAEVVRSFLDGREIEVVLPPDEPVALADRDKLFQILANLVSNASKYSPPGTPVKVQVGGKGSVVEVSVTDHGIGLTEQDRAKLFNLFYRVERPEVRQVGGTGLGLFITKNLVEMQGGHIWVESTPEQGTTFYFTVPLAKSRGKAVLDGQVINS